jgi:hypothetical protein
MYQRSLYAHARVPEKTTFLTLHPDGYVEMDESFASLDAFMEKWVRRSAFQVVYRAKAGGGGPGATSSLLAPLSLPQVFAILDKCPDALFDANTWIQRCVLPHLAGNARDALCATSNGASSSATVRPEQASSSPIIDEDGQVDSYLVPMNDCASLSAASASAASASATSSSTTRLASRPSRPSARTMPRLHSSAHSSPERLYAISRVGHATGQANEALARHALRGPTDAVMPVCEDDNDVDNAAAAAVEPAAKFQRTHSPLTVSAVAKPLSTPTVSPLPRMFRMGSPLSVSNTMVAAAAATCSPLPLPAASAMSPVRSPLHTMVQIPASMYQSPKLSPASSSHLSVPDSTHSSVSTASDFVTSPRRHMIRIHPRITSGGKYKSRLHCNLFPQETDDATNQADDKDPDKEAEEEEDEEKEISTHTLSVRGHDTALRRAANAQLARLADIATAK